MKSVKRFGFTCAVIAPIFLALDFTWLSLASARLYQPILLPHLAAQYDWKAVALFYPLYFIGIAAFVVRPMLQDDPLRATAARAFLFAIVAYGTYDLTNQATLSGWPWMLTFIDMAWGGFATCCAACAARAVLNKKG